MYIIPFWNQKIKYFDGNITMFAAQENVAYILYKLGISTETIRKWFKGKVDITDNSMIYYRSEEPEYKYEIRNTNRNVLWFLKHKRPIRFDNKTKNYIVELLSSLMSSEDIAKQSGVPLKVVNALRDNKKDIYSLNEKEVTGLCKVEIDNKKWLSRQWLHLLLENKHSTDLYRGNDLDKVHLALVIGPKFTMMLKYNSNPNDSTGHTAKLIENPDKLKKQDIPKSVLKICKTYANQPKYLNVWSDAILMARDLSMKQQRVLSMNVFGHSRKYICKKLKLNKYFVNLVLDNKFTGKVNFK